MDKEIKEILKTAKELLKNKEYKEVIKLSKSIIDRDKENYFAWVFTGAAAQELGNKEQAIAAYQKAIQFKGDQSPAWQGLAQIYEKTNCTSELVSVYSELRNIFQKDPIKNYEYSFKYANILVALSKFDQAIDVFSGLIKMENLEKDIKPLIENFSLILANPSITDQPSHVYFDFLKFLEKKNITDFDSKISLKINENALKSMIKEDQNWHLIEKQCYLILEKSSENEISLSILIEIYAELLLCKADDEQIYISQKVEEIINNSYLSEDTRLYCKTLFELIAMSSAIDQHTSIEFKNLLEKLESLTKEDYKILLTYLQNFYFSFICDHSNTIKTSQAGLKMIAQLKIKESKNFIKLLFTYNMAQSYYLQHEMNLAIDNFVKSKAIIDLNLEEKIMMKMRSSTIRYLIESYLFLSNKISALELSNLVNNLEDQKLNAEIIELLFRYYNQDYAGTYLLAKSLLAQSSENYDVQFLLAKAGYKLLTENQCQELEHDEVRNMYFQSNIKAIKLCPYRWEPIYYLGKYYKYLIKDYKKSMKCFQKSYELCQNLNLCGLELVDCLLHEKEEEIAFNILKKAIEEIENCKWASLRLGIIYLKKNEPNEAIRLFYNVIRIDPDDYIMWECLADAYLNRGSLTASLKSFNKAIELNPDSTYALYKIAHIRQSLKLYDQAIMDYYVALNKITDHVPSLKGLGETYYLKARDNVNSSTDQRYLEYIELSIKSLTKAIYLRKDLCCLWKIMGDCCNIIKYFPKQETNISIPRSIIEKNFNLSENDLVKVTRNELLKLAEESYRICCKLKPDCSYYSYDLGLTYFYQYKCIQIGDLASKGIILAKAKECLINAINMNMEEPLFWNTLGVLYATKEINRLDLAQHCFIKSLKLNENNALTWTNLGVFYLINKEETLAHECFKKSQAIEPEYSLAWIGQTEALYGYARIVCKLANDLKLRNQSIYKDFIEFLNAIPLASDCLVKYCDRIITNPDAFFLAGVLFERLSLPQTALQYYKNVFEILDDDISDINLLTIRACARLLCGQKQYEAAMLQYKNIEIKNSLEDMFGLAKIFYKLGKYQQCCKVFENALNICTENEISVIYAAMGMAQSKYNIQEAISSFFKSFQSKEPCIESLFALCSIGLLKNDMKLINAVFKELNNLTGSKYKFDIIKLKSIYYCLQKEFTKAIRCISKFIHEYPNESRGWIELCLCLKRSKAFDLSLVIAHVIFKLDAQANLILYDCIQYLLIQKLKQQNFIDQDEELLKTFQKTLHIFPIHLSSWHSFSEFLDIYQDKNRDFKPIAKQIEQVLLTK